MLRLIAGLEQPTSGEIAIGGERIEHLAPRERDIAFVFQSYALYPHMTAFENLAFSLRLRSIPTRDVEIKVRQAAQLLEIEDLLQRRPQELSGGQRQRVALGRAIVRSPKIFLFDEPLSNLDAALRSTMRVELARLHRRLGTTIVYVTHDQAEALTLGEKIIVLDKGRIQQLGTASDIYQRPTNLMVASFVGTPQMNLIAGRLDQNKAILHARGLQLDLSSMLKMSPTGLAGSSVTLGIRAEDWRLSDLATALVQGRVELIEDLGSDRFVHLICGDNLELVARADTELKLALGATIGLNVAPERVHMFQDGRRIEV